MSEGGKEAVRADDEVVAKAEVVGAAKADPRAAASPGQEDFGERDFASGGEDRPRTASCSTAIF